MAAPSRILSLNLGMQTVGAAEFRSTPDGGLTIVNWKTVELIVDPAADATRPAQIEGAIGELRESMGLAKKETAQVTLPSQSVFSRFVRLPGATAQDVTEIIKFEAQQNVPFPIDEVVWDYQIMGEVREGNWDVGIVAIKADQLGEVVDSVAKSGIRPFAIDAAPFALYNAFRFNYSDLTGCSLIVDVGARTTNLIFVEGQRLFSRTIPVGGSSISTAVAKEFHQDITLAERLKVEKGFVGLGGAYEQPDDATVAKISKVVRNTMTRLHAEIARSISFYRQSQHGSAPVRGFLAGGSVGMPYMIEFFAEKLQIPIEHFNALRNVTVGNEPLAQELAGKAHALGELVGGGLRQVGECPVEINLRPLSLVKEQDLAKRKPFLIGAVACVLAGLGAWYAYFQQANVVVTNKLEEVNAIAAGLDGFAKKLDAADKAKKELEAAAAPLLLAASERTAWTLIIDELGKSLPPRFIWITKMTPLSGSSPVSLEGAVATGPDTAPRRPAGGPRRPGARTAEDDKSPPAIDALEIRGLYLANPPNTAEAGIIDEFVERLQSSPAFKIEDAEKEKLVPVRTTPDGLSWAYSYTIILPLRERISLP
jgi:type IV pilus assembly protein PilM